MLGEKTASHQCEARTQCAPFFDAVEALLGKLRAGTHRVPADGDYCDMPLTCGSSAWALLHGIADALHDEVCPSCGAEARRLVRFVHDIVNIKLGKPAYDGRNYEAVMKEVLAGAQPINLKQCGTREQAMIQACNDRGQKSICAAALECTL